MHRFESEAARIEWELTPQPGWIASPDGPLMSWYHPPRDRAAGPAVLLCDTLGSDRMNLHLAYRHLALQLAWHGYPTLRVDYAGTADSAGSPRDPDRVGAWLRGLDCGAEQLKQLSGASELVVFGALLGATLAAGLAAKRSDVTGLAAWGPVCRGRDFLRQLKAAEKLWGTDSAGPRPAQWQDGDLESLGFLYTAETVASLDELAVDRLRPTHLRRVCVMPWEAHDSVQRFAAAAATWGAELEQHAIAPSSGDASLQHQAVPEDVISTVLTWLDGHEATPSRQPDAASVYLDTVKLPRCGAGQPLEESCVRMGADASLFGLLTQPAAGAPSHQLAEAGHARIGIILVNGGNNHRCGINRNYTEWARRWAGQGATVLRIDIRGLGDSPPMRQADLNKLYRTSTADDVIRAMDWLQGHRSIDRFVLVGLCAGAFQALHAARRDKRVLGLALIELLRFYHIEQRVPGRALRWARRAAAALSLPGPMGWWIQRLCARGTSVLVVYRPDETMYHAFQSELAWRRRRIEATKRLSLALIPQANHIFSPLWSQERLSTILDHFVADRMMPS